MPPKFRPNEPDAAKRRMRCYLYQPDGASPLSRSTSLTGALWIAQGTSEFTAAAAGTMTNDSRTLTFSALTFGTVNQNPTNTVTITSHGLQTGDGPVQLTTTGALPTGLATATNYWIIAVDTNTVAFATSLANAYAGTKISLTSAGSGTNQITSVAATVRYLDGSWTYEATQSELNFTGSLFSLLVSLPNTLQEDVFTAEMEDRPESVFLRGPTFIQSQTDATKMVVQFPWFSDNGTPGATAPLKTDLNIHPFGGSWANPTNDSTLVSATAGMAELALVTSELATAGPFWIHASKTGYRDVFVLCNVSNTNPGQDVFAAIAEGSHTYGDEIRGIASVIIGKVKDFTTNTLTFRDLGDTKDRITETVDATGRTSVTLNDLT